ncbi:MAG: hypothetical protein KJ674_03350 [Nanoarchaeota archaeon]|nr:hypothetical protein [Nanoarchaeota archaeon]
MKNWRELVDPLIKDHLEIQIKESSRHKKAYDLAANKGDAQLWIAIANLSKQTFNIELKIKYIEKVLQDIVSKINNLEHQKETIVAKEIIKKTAKKKPAKKTTPKPKKKTLKKALKKF